MISQYIEAPNKEAPRFKSIFLAGGITNCPDWQKEVADALKDHQLTIFNPRRSAYPKEENAVREQIEWEYERLRSADLISFWFSAGSVNPITLFELGSALERGAPLAIGADPRYTRERDLEIQIALRKSGVKIHTSLDSLVADIKVRVTPKTSSSRRSF